MKKEEGEHWEQGLQHRWGTLKSCKQPWKEGKFHHELTRWCGLPRAPLLLFESVAHLQKKKKERDEQNMLRVLGYSRVVGDPKRLGWIGEFLFLSCREPGILQNEASTL